MVDSASARCHIVVGAGAAGITLAYSLAEYDDVILIEISDSNDVISDPSLWTFAALSEGDRRIRHRAVPSYRFLNRQFLYPQGSGIGGTMNINAMIWCAGHPAVYDNAWPSQWSSTHLQRRLSPIVANINPVRVHSSGFLNTILTSTCNGTRDAALFDVTGAAASYLTTMSNDDIIQNLLRRKRPNDILFGQYHSSGAKPSVSKGFISVEKGWEAIRIEFEGDRAVRVICRRLKSGHSVSSSSEMVRSFQPTSDGEIIICAGVFETPRLLIASGLSGDYLVKSCSSTPSPPIIPDIASSVQDHAIIPILFVGDWQGRVGSFLKSFFTGKQRESYAPSTMSPPPNGVHGWISLDAKGNIWETSSEKLSCVNSPSVQLLAVDGQILPGLLTEALPRFGDRCTGPAWLYMAYIRPILATVLKFIAGFEATKWFCRFWIFGFLVCVVRPCSTGRMKVVRKKDSDDDPGGTEDMPGLDLDIDLGLLSDPRDSSLLYSALRTARKLVHSAVINNSNHDNNKKNFAPPKSHFLLHDCIRWWWYFELCPGPLFLYALPQTAFWLFSAVCGMSYFHACGSCPMSTSCPAATTTTAEEYSPKCDSKVKTPLRSYKHGDGVVDQRLRVLGVLGLRIADASVVPPRAISSGPISALCMGIGAACADFIREDNIAKNN